MIMIIIIIIISRGSAIGTATVVQCWAVRGSNPGQSKIFSSPKRPDQQRGPLSFVFSVTAVFFPRGWDIDVMKTGRCVTTLRRFSYSVSIIRVRMSQKPLYPLPPQPFCSRSVSYDTSVWQTALALQPLFTGYFQLSRPWILSTFSNPGRVDARHFNCSCFSDKAKNLQTWRQKWLNPV